MALSGDGMGAERSPCASGSASSGREDAARRCGVRAARRSSRTTLTASVTFLSACPVLQVLIPPPVFGPSGSLYQERCRGGGMRGPAANRRGEAANAGTIGRIAVSYTHLRAHETRHDLVCR